VDVVAWQWGVFAGLVAVLLTLDLFVFHRHDRIPTMRASAGWTVFWCLLAVAFNGLVWWWRGAEHGWAFLTGYVVEWSLSMDNVFVFAVIFRFFKVPRQYQYRVLFWGILGAIVLRLAFVLAGVQLIHRFDWVIPLFGAFLVYTALKLVGHSESEVHPENNVLLRLARRVFRVSRGGHEEHGNAFFVREAGRPCITPLFLVLLVIESTDVLFAVDSVPAILGITSDAFVAFTSNVFAILGLRALYFLLAGAIEKFRYLHYGLAAVLAFVGGGMIAEYVAHSFFKRPPEDHLRPPWAKLLVIAAVLGIAIFASIAVKREETRDGGRGMK